MACVATLANARLGPSSSSRARNAVPSAVAARAGRPLQAAAAAPGQRRQQRRQQQQRSGTLLVRALRNIDWPQALLFDCDGVLVDTEAEGHRVAFNEAFKRKGAVRCLVCTLARLSPAWCVAYGAMLQQVDCWGRGRGALSPPLCSQPHLSTGEAASRANSLLPVAG